MRGLGASPGIERWRPAPGYEGWYAVSDRGRIKRVMPARGATPGRILAARPKRGTGRLYVNLQRGGEGKRSVFVHRLVAMAFVPGRSAEHDEVNQLNGAFTGNRAASLVWTDHAGNMAHAVAHRLTGAPRGEAHHLAVLTDARVAQLRTSGMPPKVLARRWGVSLSTAEKAYYGLTWRHVDPPRPS